MADTVIGSISVAIKAKNDQLVAGLKGANASISQFGSKFKQDFGALSLVAAGFATAVGTAVFKSIKAYGEEEQAIAELNQALKNQGVAVNEASADLTQYAAELQKVTTFGDETIIGLQAQLVSYGLTGEALKTVTKTTLDFAAAKKIDLKAAADLVGKAFVGETGTLSRYGIILDKNIPKVGQFSEVINQLNDRFGGQAEAQRNTTLGQLQGMQNAFGDLQEVLGSFLAGPATKLFTWLTKKINLLISAKETLSGVSGSFKELGVTLVQTVIQAIADSTMAFLKFMQTVTLVGPLFNALGIDMDGLNAKIDAQVQKLNQNAQAHLINVQKKLEAERMRAQQEQAIRTAENTSKITEKTNLAASEVVIEQQRLEEMQKLQKEADDFTAEMQKNAEKRNQEIEKQRQEAFQEHKALLTSISSESETAMTTIFSKNLDERQKKQQLFSQVMGGLQRQLTSAVIASFAQQKAQAVRTSAVEAGAAKAPIAAGFFKAHSGIPFVGQAIALGFIAAAFSFLDRVAKFNTGGVVPGAGSRDTVPALLTPGERVLTQDQNRMFNAIAGAALKNVDNNPQPNIVVNISGQFIEGNEAKWQQMIRNKLIPEIRRSTQFNPGGPFNRVRGAP